MIEFTQSRYTKMAFITRKANKVLFLYEFEFILLLFSAVYIPVLSIKYAVTGSM